MGERSFQLKIVNGSQGDPVIYVSKKMMGEAFLFDLGSIDALSHKELLKIRWVFVSHTHMDHFIGFDRLLRVNVPHRRLIHMWGPAPLINQVQAKLRAYTWNLIASDQIRFQVSEIHGDGLIEEALLSNSDGFDVKRQVSPASTDQLCMLSDGSRVAGVRLDHKGTPSIAYRVESPPRYRVNVEALTALGLKQGAWLSDLQAKIKQRLLQESIEIEGKKWTVQDLASHFIQTEAGESLAYFTDLSFDPENLKLLKSQFPPVDEVICECSFLDADVQRAVDKAHLSSRQSALIASILGASKLHSFHVSGIYGQGPGEVIEETARYFEEFKAFKVHDLAQAIEVELKRVMDLRR